MAAAAARLLTMSCSSGVANFSNENSSHLVVSMPKTLMCLSKVGLSSGGGERELPVAAKAGGVLVSEPKMDKGVELAFLLDKMSGWIIKKEWPWRLHFEMFVEKSIIECRFFTLLATAGSLLGSVLCFVQGCFLIVESYCQYFHSLTQMSEQGQVVLLLIEAIDTFIVGATMLVFGMGLHVMFVGQDNFKLSRNFNLQKLLSRIGIKSASQAKSRIGQAVIMILQVQVLEKCKSIAMTNGLDLAFFAGAIFMSSASIFLLSRIESKS